MASGWRGGSTLPAVEPNQAEPFQPEPLAPMTGYEVPYLAQPGYDPLVSADYGGWWQRGIAIVKAVVPGILPMCFGHAQQRLKGQWRLAAALAGTPEADRAIPYDPHPFP